MSIFDNETPEFEPWTPEQHLEARCMLSDLWDMAESKGLDGDEAIKHHKLLVNGTDFNKWCNGIALKSDRIGKE